jgi:hypothetical protein
VTGPRDEPVTETRAHLVIKVMAPVRVIVGGPEAAELWRGDERLAVTVLYDGRLHLRIDPRADGQPWLIEAPSLALALDEAARRIAAS